MSSDPKQLKKLLREDEPFDQRYELEEEVGSGSFSVIFRAHDRRDDRTVAIKAITPRARRRSDTAAGRFRREMKVIRSLDHRNIISLYDWKWTDDGVVYMVLEYIEGRTLNEIVHGDPMDEPTAVATARQLAEALAVAHDAGVVHRDLKPANVMLTRSRQREHRRVKVLDFGMAKALSPLGDESIVDLTAEGMAVGTPRYIAPEQARGEQLTPKADLYAVGLLMYEMFTGKRLVTADTVEGALSAHLADDPLELRDDEYIPERFRPVIRRLLRKDPQYRIPSARRLLEVLDDPLLLEPVDESDEQLPRIGPPLGDVTGDFPAIGDDKPPEEPSEESQEVAIRPQRRAAPSSTRDDNAGDEAGDEIDSEPICIDEEALEAARNSRHQRGTNLSQLVPKKRRGHFRRFSFLRSPRHLGHWLEAMVTLVLVVMAFLSVGAQTGGWTYEQRLLAGILPLVMAVVWAAVGRDNSWGGSVGRKGWICCGVAASVAHLIGPDALALELLREPAWFLEPVSGYEAVEHLEAVVNEVSYRWAMLILEFNGGGRP